MSSSALISLPGSNLISIPGSNLISISGSNLISIPGSNLISFTQLQLWLLRDTFTPGCHQILSSHGPLFTMLQNIASLSPSCSLQLCVQNPTSS
ncbi:unnamed protein product [Staurois parvus]|uniref:Uncharacterized protein n=1 Tax=Staurois parvus TaxID=386267 RepID=A0ABN9CS33_9NEOB|nr:unnamed protein product [Staurois parvus]